MSDSLLLPPAVRAPRDLLAFDVLDDGRGALVTIGRLTVFYWYGTPLAYREEVIRAEGLTFRVAARPDFVSDSATARTAAFLAQVTPAEPLPLSSVEGFERHLMDALLVAYSTMLRRAGLVAERLD